MIRSATILKAIIARFAFARAMYTLTMTDLKVRTRRK